MRTQKKPKYTLPWAPPSIGVIRRKKKKVVSWHSGPLPLKKVGLTKFIFWCDQQWPYIIPITGMLQMIEAWQPHYLILGGDTFNGDPFDHWSKNKPGLAKEMPDPKEHYEKFQAEFMDPVRKALGKGSLVYMIGNHEAWASKAVEMNAEGRGYWEIENNVKGVDFWVPQFKTVNLGKLFFAHGDMVNSGQNSAKKLMAIYNRNLWVGHHHRDESFTAVSPVDDNDKKIARVIGCWCKLNPHYAKDKPNSWINGFGKGYVAPSGKFWAEPKWASEKGEFLFEGKMYGVKP